MRLLVIEPDLRSAACLSAMLKAEAFDVDHSATGDEGLVLAKLYRFDAILAEPHLPDMRNFAVLRALRGARIKTPVLVLSCLAGVDDKVAALRFGADDYIVKPWHRDELVARIRAVARRSAGHSES